MLVEIFGALAEYERTLINERAEVAREVARIRGKRTGRPRALSADKTALARRIRESGESIADICSALRVGSSTLYRVLSEEPEVAGR